jgi:hypothetical protein
MDGQVGATGTIDNWMLALQTSPAILPIAAQTTPENTPALWKWTW